MLRAEFSYIPPEIPRFENRFAGIRSGNCLMALLYTMQAMLGYGDDYEDLRDFQQIALRGFAALRGLNSLADITCFDPHAKRRYNCPYIDENVYLPNAYTLEMLAYTRAWRSDANRRLLAEAINRMDEMPEDGNCIQIRIRGKYMAPGWALVRPFRPFRADCIDTIMYRRPLTELAMLGLGGAAGRPACVGRKHSGGDGRRRHTAAGFPPFAQQAVFAQKHRVSGRLRRCASGGRLCGRDRAAV